MLTNCMAHTLRQAWTHVETTAPSHKHYHGPHRKKATKEHLEKTSGKSHVDSKFEVELEAAA